MMVEQSQRKQRALFEFGLSAVVLIVLLIAAFLLFETRGRREVDKLNVMRIAAKQSAMFNETARLSYELVAAEDPQRVRQLRSELRLATDEFEQVYNGLLHGDKRLNLPPGELIAINQFYYAPETGLYNRVRSYLLALQKLAATDVHALDQDNADFALIRQEVESGELLADFDALMAAFQQDARDQVVRSHRLDYLIFAAILATLLLGAVVFARTWKAASRGFDDSAVGSQTTAPEATYSATVRSGHGGVTESTRRGLPMRFVHSDEPVMTGVFVAVVVVLCLLPSLLHFVVGVDFGVRSIPFDRNVSLAQMNDLMHHALAGSFTHTLLEWTAFCAALFTAALALTHYRIRGGVVTPLIGISLFWGGCLDCFHTLAADRLLHSTAPHETLVPLTWAIGRIFNGLILFVGVGAILLWGRRHEVRTNFIFITSLGVLFGVVAYAVIAICATSDYLPDVVNEDSFVRRPWEIGPLLIYLALGTLIFPQLYFRHPGFFSLALWISAIPQVGAQLHVAFGSSELFDHDFNVAHFLKIVAYIVPAVGLLMSYTALFKTERRSREDLEALTGELAYTQKRLNHALTGGNVGLWDWEAATDEIHFSSQLRSQLGFGDDAPWHTFHDLEKLMHPDDREGVLDNVKKTLDADTQRFQATFRLMNAAGEYRWIMSQGEAERDDDGRVTRMIGVHVDITEQKLLDLRLRETEARFRRLFDAAPAGMLIVGSDGRIELVNSTLTAQFGFGSDEIVGQPVEILVPEALRESHVAARSEYQKNPSTRWIGELRDLCGQRKDGSHFPVEVGLTPLQVDGRTVVLATVVDITQRKKFEADLEREQYLLGTLVNNMPDAIYFKDRNSKFIRVNRGVLNIFDLQHEDELLGKSDADFFSAKEAAEYRSDEQFIMDTGRPLINKEEVEIWADGQEHVVLTTKMPLYDEHRQVVGTFGISRDITQLKETETALRRYAAELERSNEQLDQFAYVASHDLRSPLRNIENLAEWIEEDAAALLPSESREHLRLMRKRVARMNRLLTDLLEYSRVGRKESKPEPVDVRALLDDVIDMLAPPEGFRIEIDGELPIVNAPRTALRKVFQNLIDNAIKHHHRDKGCIRVTASRREGMLEFAVSDDGPGIAAAFHEKIFQIFQTLHHQNEEVSVGMGLAIVKRTVETYGGTIKVESEEGQGATFRFTWR